MGTSAFPPHSGSPTVCTDVLGGKYCLEEEETEAQDVWFLSPPRPQGPAPPSPGLSLMPALATLGAFSEEAAADGEMGSQGQRDMTARPEHLQVLREP